VHRFASRLRADRGRGGRLGQSALAAGLGAAQAANSADGAALGDSLVVEGLAEFEVHGTSNEWIGSRLKVSGICSGQTDSGFADSSQ